MAPKRITLESIDTDAKNPRHNGPESPQDPNICALTGEPIVSPSGTLEEIRLRTANAASLSPNAQVRAVLREIDPGLN